MECKTDNLNIVHIHNNELFIGVNDEYTKKYIDSEGELINMPDYVLGDFTSKNKNLRSLKNIPHSSRDIYIQDAELDNLIGLQEEVGSLYIFHNKLKSLEGCPKEILHYFNCSNNELTSLKFGPEKVGYVYNCSNNKLINGEYLPKKLYQLEISNNLIKDFNDFTVKKIKHDLLIGYNLITTFEHMPYVGGDLKINNNQLTSFKFIQKEIKGSLHVDGNNLESLEHMPIVVKNFGASKCNLKDLKFFNKVYRDVFLNDNELTSLKGLPEEMKNRILRIFNNELTSLKHLPKKLSILTITKNPLRNLNHAYNCEIFCDKELVNEYSFIKNTNYQPYKDYFKELILYYIENNLDFTKTDFEDYESTLLDSGKGISKFDL